MKLRLDGREISEDVSMVKFKIVQDGRTRTVMNELRPFIAESRVVLVGFDDKEGGIGQPRRNTKPLRHPPDEERGLQSRLLQYPGQYRRGGGLAVGAGNAKNPALAENILGQPLRPRHVGPVSVENFLKQRIAARNGIADDEQIGIQADLIRAVSFGQEDALLFQLGAHRWIDVGIAAGDPMAGGTRQEGDAAHEGAASAKNVNVHDRVWMFGVAGI